MKQFFHYFFSVMDDTDKKNFKKYILVLFFGSIFSVLGIGAVIPFMNALIQPDKITNLGLFQNWHYNSIIFCLTVVMITAFLIKNIAALLLLAYQSNFLYGLTAKVQQKLFSGYMSLPYEYHLNRSTPDLIKIVNNETTMFGSYVVAPLGSFLSEMISSVFILLVLLMLNPVFTILVSVFLFAGIFCFMKAIKVKISHYASLRTDSWSSMTNQVLSGLTGIKEVKLYHCENFFLGTFSQNVDDLKSSSAYQYTYQQAPRMLIEFIGLAVVMSVLCGFVFMGTKPESLFVLLGVFGIAAAQLLPSLNRLTQALVQIKYGMPALKTIYEELNKFTQVSKQNQNQIKKLEFNSQISVSNLGYTYSDGTIALKGVNLDIKKGQRVAFVGSSGAGKTTFVDLLMGLYFASKGQIQLDGKTLSESDIFSFQKLFAYIPQSIILYDKSIKENIAFGIDIKDIDEARVNKCLESACLMDFVSHLKEKENTFIGEGGTRLSGGQRQRLGIARALYQQAEILVMDEATSALDYKTEREITDLFSVLNNFTIITIAHRLTTIKNYDVIYVFDKGCVVASGTYNELLKSSDVFQGMLKAVDKKPFLNKGRVFNKDSEKVFC